MKLKRKIALRKKRKSSQLSSENKMSKYCRCCLDQIEKQKQPWKYSLLAIEFGETKPEEPINPHSTGAKSESHQATHIQHLKGKLR